MDQEIQQLWSPEILEEEEDLLIRLQDQYFFDMNFMVVPDIKIPFFKFEVLSSQEYDNQRKRLLFTMLKYDIGLEILIKLIHRRDQSPLNGHYFLKTLDEMAHIIFQMQYDLLDILNKKNQCYPHISKRISQLYKSILIRKKKDCARLNINADLQLYQQQYDKIIDIDCYINYFPYFSDHLEEIEQVFENEQNNILRQIITLDDGSLFSQLQTLSIFQQELLMTYLNNENVRENYFGLYLAIRFTDHQFDFAIIVQNMMPYYFEIENWKLLVILQLMQQHKEQDAYELLLASKIEWNDLTNADIIIQLLIASQRALQAYVYVTELRNENALKFFVKEMIIQNQIPNLLQIDFTPDQDKIVNEIIKNTPDQILLIEFVKKLLRTRKYFQAIEFYSKVKKSGLHAQIERIEDLILRCISQLPEIEEQYYKDKMNENQLTQDQILIEAILENQDINQVRNTNNIKYFVDHTNLISSKDCYGWKRTTLIGGEY